MDDFEDMLPEVNGEFIRKCRHPARLLDDIDPAFNTKFDPTIHSKDLKELKTGHLPPDNSSKLIALVKEFWCVFDKKGLLVPVKDYECVIDTGNHPPIACRNPNYGHHEIPIMKEAIGKLLELNQIKQVFDGAWLSKALLAPKPHQEHVTHIDKFVWRFCVSYVALNAITRVVAFSIPRCDAAVNMRMSKFRWLMDAPSGYHQIRVEKNSQQKLAFAGPEGTKFTYLVMPFGPVNGPFIFIVFIHDLDTTWKANAVKKGIIIDKHTNTKIIVDDIHSWAQNYKTAFAYLRCQLEVCWSQNLSLSLKKISSSPID